MPFIEARDLSKSFAGPSGPRQVLRGVSLDVERGEFVCLIGAMGSGKSTLLSLLSGLTRPDSGSIVIDGRPLIELRRDTAVVFQNYSLLPWFSSLENVRLAVAAAFPECSAHEHVERAANALDRVGLGRALERRPGQLSGGMRQRVALARALATEPQVLFLDEPLGALDALTRETLQHDLLRLCHADRPQPVTTVMITNSVEEALLLADRIVPMRSGPPGTLGAPIPIDLDRPRDLSRDERAARVRAHVIGALTASGGRRDGVTSGSVREVGAPTPATARASAAAIG